MLNHADVLWREAFEGNDESVGRVRQMTALPPFAPYPCAVCGGAWTPEDMRTAIIPHATRPWAHIPCIIQSEKSIWDISHHTICCEARSALAAFGGKMLRVEDKPGIPGDEVWWVDKKTRTFQRIKILPDGRIIKLETVQGGKGETHVNENGSKGERDTPVADGGKDSVTISHNHGAPNREEEARPEAESEGDESDIRLDEWIEAGPGFWSEEPDPGPQSTTG